jgi:serine/threonine protein kinase/tetratricopeptide (TPR) repeat protein
MTPEKWQRVRTVFLAAVEYPADEREAFLSDACSDDIALRQEVESLLAGHLSSGHMLDRGLGSVAGNLLNRRNPAHVAGKALGSYRIEREIGRGGMGEVYLAHDTRLNRPVAIKLLPAGLHDDPELLRRFQQEARAASLLNHPNIVTIHEVAESNDVPFIVSEFVAGRTLRALIQNGIGLDDALDLMIQTAGALGAAHAAGIVHRDIKPENIMVRDDGYVKVLDFGLAKLLRPEDRFTLKPRVVISPSEPSTLSGMIVGTVKYMSPEQARGERIDHRTDIFSLAVVLYELVAGRGPFTGTSSSDQLASLLRDDAPPLTLYVADAPDALTPIINKALQKHPDERYQTVGEFQDDLKRLKQDLDLAKRLSSDPLRPISSLASPKSSAGTAALGYIGAEANPHGPAQPATLSGWYRRVGQRKVMIPVALFMLIIGAASISYFQDSGRSDTLAVLPFEYSNSDPSDASAGESAYVADGLVESLIQTLAQAPNLTVIARSSVMRYKGETTDPKEAGRVLNVRNIVTGRVIQHGDALTVSAEMVDARNDRRLWGDRYEINVSELQATQRKIVHAVSERLHLQLTTRDEQRLSRPETSSDEAYQLYLKGRYLWNKRTEADINKAIEYYKQSVEQDPNYARAYVGLAEAYVLLSEYTKIPSEEADASATRAAMKALSIDEDLGEAHAALGLAAANEWNWQDAVREFTRAVELGPNYATAHHWYSLCLTSLGRFDEAMAEIEKARKLDPVSISINAAAGVILYYSGRYEQAAQRFEKGLELNPNAAGVRIHLGRAYEQGGRYQEAIEQFQKAEALLPRDEGLPSEFACLYAMSGDRASAARYLQAFQMILPNTTKRYYQLARAFAALDDKEQAFPSLEQAFNRREVDMQWLQVDPQLRSLRKDSRFDALVKRVGFAR